MVICTSFAGLVTENIKKEHEIIQSMASMENRIEAKLQEIDNMMYKPKESPALIQERK